MAPGLPHQPTTASNLPPRITSTDVAKYLAVCCRTARNILSRLMAANLLAPKGRGRGRAFDRDQFFAAWQSYDAGDGPQPTATAATTAKLKIRRTA
jgi:hypothetical protein